MSGAAVDLSHNLSEGSDPQLHLQDGGLFCLVRDLLTLVLQPSEVLSWSEPVLPAGNSTQGLSHWLSAFGLWRSGVWSSDQTGSSWSSPGS